MLFRQRRFIRPSMIACFIFCILSAGHGAMAQGLNPVTFTGKLEPGQLKPGQKAKLSITAKIDPSWHLYSLTQPPGGPRPTRLSIDESGPFKMDGTPQQPKPVTEFDPNFQIDTQTFSNQVTFIIPVMVNADAQPGPQKIVAKVYFQACDDHQCLPPRTKPVEVETVLLAANAKVQEAAPAALTTAPAPGPAAKPSPSVSPSPVASETPQSPMTGAAGSVTQSPTASAGSVDDGDENKNLRKRGLLGYILFAMGVGFLSLLTPCVFPMIPITVSFFTKREHRTMGEAIKQALVYCFGIIITFTGLGLALTLIAGPSGINKVAASPWMNLFLTTLFVVFALNLFGMFEIQLPTGLISKLDSKTRSGTTAATLLMGLTFTLTSFTCTAAFVGTVLVAVTQGEWFWPTLGMLAFSTAFALPFFLLALFPKWMQSLPKSGGWMNSVKVVMGFLEIGAAFKFLSNVDLVWGWNTVTRNLVLAAWIAISIVTMIYLLGKFQLPHDTPVQKISVARMLSATFFLGLALYFLTGLFGGNLGEWEAMLPPVQASSNTGFTLGGSNTRTAWVESYDEALLKARTENKPLFLNFTGVTCTNCRWMESNMFTDPSIKKELENFVLAELFTDRETSEDERNGQLQAEKFGTVALPLYAIIDSKGNTLAKFPGLTRDKKEFIGFLNKGAGKYRELTALK